MKADLERLLISEAELLELTGFDRQKILESTQLSPRQTKVQKLISIASAAIAFITIASIFLPTLRITGIVFLISLTLGTLSFAIEFAEVAVLFFCVAIGSAVYSLLVLIGTTLGVIVLCLSLAIACGGVTFFLAKWIMQTWKVSKNSQQKKVIPPIIWRLFKEVDKCNRAIGDIDIFDQLQDAGNPIKLESRESAIAALRMTRNDIVRAMKTERILRENPDFHPDRFDIDLNAFEALQISDRAKEYGRVFDTTLQIAIDVQKAMQELQEFSN
ncbi:hypothetical protein H6F42_07575 [Pseudanabaena sp. FACHB-1998]|uniref:hypothetical protein n=1 Tax=Pseudanabaena sp. FACHB-1998 TaxID=2692858 RepID=UPI001680BD6E|nr:hypothetical protein [Pseudanabaena sp. FACHB-1998]MBD2176772.1 hypothetical protein [Pseudanabaena sp. FACHB-1998]